MNVEQMKRLAAIDIGSNAVRLLIADIGWKDEKEEQVKFKKLKLYRVPVRLGVDAFTLGYISESLIDKLCQALQAFRLIMDVYEVEDYRACATSALREASNTEEVLEQVLHRCNIEIELIDGRKEADLILSNKKDASRMIDKRFNHLYVDVGGGSTEISLLDTKGISVSKSFKIGTIRLHHKQINKAKWNDMGEWLKKNIKPQKPLSILGSGGNINRIFKRSNNRMGEPLIYDFVKQERDLLHTLTIDERIYLQDLNNDRAEVIVPALNIFLFVMDHTGIRQIVVPKIGLSDGIIRQLFRELVVV